MDIQLPQILFQMVNFGVVAGALTYLLYKPVLKILDERSKRIEEAQQAAASNLREKEEMEKLKEEELSKVRKEAQQILDKAKELAKKTKIEAVTEAKDLAEAELTKARQGWEKEQKKIAAEMREQFASSVLAVSEKVLGKTLDQKAQGKLIDAELKNIIGQLS